MMLVTKVDSQNPIAASAASGTVRVPSAPPMPQETSSIPPPSSLAAVNMGPPSSQAQQHVHVQLANATQDAIVPTKESNTKRVLIALAIAVLILIAYLLFHAH
jgi:hypothetical protein